MFRCYGSQRTTLSEFAKLSASLLSLKCYGWDALNRMTSYGTTSSYVYRADGMRVSKFVGSTATTYAYDGQMGMEDVDVTAGVSTITDYGLGARGVDYISSTKSGTTTVGFPIYDAHGNMTACLFRSGSNYYSLANQRHYDAWGQVRSGAISGDPKGRYCANLGHKQDDESGLVYMRARYYEPSSGRFLNEDDAKNNANWFTYSANDPVNRVDQSGQDDILIWLERLVGSGLTIWLAKCIYKTFLAKTLSEGIFAAGEYLQSVAQGLISGGQADIQEGVELLNAGGDSLVQAATAGLGGIGLCVGGAATLVAGIALDYIAIGIEYLGLWSTG